MSAKMPRERLPLGLEWTDRDARPRLTVPGRTTPGSPKRHTLLTCSNRRRQAGRWCYSDQVQSSQAKPDLLLKPTNHFSSVPGIPGIPGPQRFPGLFPSFPPAKKLLR